MIRNHRPRASSSESLPESLSHSLSESPPTAESLSESSIEGAFPGEDDGLLAEVPGNPEGMFEDVERARTDLEYAGELIRGCRSDPRLAAALETYDHGKVATGRRVGRELAHGISDRSAGALKQPVGQVVKTAGGFVPFAGVGVHAASSVRAQRRRRAHGRIADTASRDGNPLASALGSGLSEHYRKKRNKSGAKSGLSMLTSALAPVAPGADALAPLTSDVLATGLNSAGTGLASKALSTGTAKGLDKGVHRPELPELDLGSERKGKPKRMMDRLRRKNERGGYGNLDGATEDGEGFELREPVGADDARHVRALLSYLGAPVSYDPGALAALGGDEVEAEQMLQCERNRDVLRQALNAEPGFDGSRPQTEDEERAVHDLKRQTHGAPATLQRFAAHLGRRAPDPYGILAGDPGDAPTNYLQQLSAIEEIRPRRGLRERGHDRRQRKLSEDAPQRDLVGPPDLAE